MDQLQLRHLLRPGDELAFEPEQICGNKAAYAILSIDGNLVKVITQEGFRLLPLHWLAQCANERRLWKNGQLLQAR
ncbi:MAG: hypothetical protein ACOX2K_03945 [Bacillota bacterium]|jgi:hypothetical protein